MNAIVKNGKTYLSRMELLYATSGSINKHIYINFFTKLALVGPSYLFFFWETSAMYIHMYTHERTHM